MSAAGQWETTGRQLLRATGGGLLFGVPLLYTMEVWWLGETVQPAHALAALAVTFVPVFLLVASSGFRKRPDLTRLEVAVDTVTIVGLSLLSTALVLLVLQRITVTAPAQTVVQTIVVESAPFAIGAAVANEVFSKATDQPQRQQENRHGRRGDQDEEGRRGTVWDLGATAVGATFIAVSIAPTDEVPMLATGLEPPSLVALIALSLVVTYAIVFVAGFSDQERRRQQLGVLQHPATETAIAYLLALLVSAALLWFFGNLDLADPLGTGLVHAVVLSFPASLGGAAGRLVV